MKSNNKKMKNKCLNCAHKKRCIRFMASKIQWTGSEYMSSQDENIITIIKIAEINFLNDPISYITEEQYNYIKNK